jgi:hypothetical protein
LGGLAAAWKSSIPIPLEIVIATAPVSVQGLPGSKGARKQCMAETAR